MFDNIGSKIMKLARILCWVGIVLSVISGIVIMGSGSGAYRYNSIIAGSSIVYGILTIVIGCLASWISSFFIYGFGQLIENSDRIRDMMQNKN